MKSWGLLVWFGLYFVRMSLDSAEWAFRTPLYLIWAKLPHSLHRPKLLSQSVLFLWDAKWARLLGPCSLTVENWEGAKNGRRNPTGGTSHECRKGYNHRVSTWRVGHDNCCHHTKICDNSWCVPGGVWWTPFPGWSASCRKGKWLRRSLHLAKYPCHHHYISTSGYFPNFTSFGNVSWMKMVVITIYHRNIPWAYTLAWLCLLKKVCRPTWPRSSKGQRSVSHSGRRQTNFPFKR